MNQHQKRQRLPSAGLLKRVHQQLVAWWEEAYLSLSDPGLADRFFLEARASLPALGAEVAVRSLEEVFAGDGLQRLRLKQDQQVPECDP